ncbi:MAG: cell division protein FtsA [Rhodocyclaceae bacterium]
MSNYNKDYVIGIDPGTSKTVAIAAEIDEDNNLNVLGISKTPSKGIQSGRVSNIEEMVETINIAVDELRNEVQGLDIGNAYVSISGDHIRSSNSTGLVAIKGNEVTELDIEEVIKTAKATSIPADQEILHTIVQEYKIDGQYGIDEPIGMSGRRLEVHTHIVSGGISAMQNIIKCVRRCDVDVNDLVLQPLAASHAVLSKDEKDIGVCLVDIGGGTIDIAVWTSGAIRATWVLPIAGEHITTDIAMVIRTPKSEAEIIKCKYGTAISELAEVEESIEVIGIDDRPTRSLSKRALADVIQPRVEEMFEHVQAELRHGGFIEALSSGVVLTGGASVMPGMVELGEDILGVPVRLGIPKYKGNLSEKVCRPDMATAYGLLLEALNQRKRSQKIQEKQNIGDTFSRLKQWFVKNF